MKVLKEEFNKANDVSCDKVQDVIDDAALKTITHYQTCVEKVTSYAEADLNSLAFDGSLITKEIEYAKVSASKRFIFIFKLHFFINMMIIF